MDGIRKLFRKGKAQEQTPALPSPKSSVQRLPDAQAAQPKAGDEVWVYGKRFCWRRGSLAFRKGEEPPLIVGMKSLVLPCPLGQWNQNLRTQEHCGRGLQIPLSLVPLVAMCRFCFSLLFIEKRDTPPYDDADRFLKVAEAFSVMGYAVTPLHCAQSDLHGRIQEFTSGNGVLLPTGFTADAEEKLGISNGKVLVMPMGYTQAELDEVFHRPSELAAAISETAFAICESGQFLRAVAIAKRALVIDPDTYSAHYVLGRARTMLGDYQNAVNSYQAALHIDPSSAEAHFDLGCAYGVLGQTAEEVREYQEAIRIRPDFAQAHLNLGEEYRRQGRFEEAIRELRIALRIAPDDPGPNYGVGLVYLQLGRWKEAANHFQSELHIP